MQSACVIFAAQSLSYGPPDGVREDAAAWLMLCCLGLVFGVGLLFIYLACRQVRRDQFVRAIVRRAECRAAVSGGRDLHWLAFTSPHRWLAIKARNWIAVQEVLGLHNPKPCSWAEGLVSREEKALILSPPIRGWILVMGNGLPDPADDVDRCFHFLVRLSRKLGEVQYFSVNRAVDHHAYARLDRGRVIRAYAWAGETVWNQGPMTMMEGKLKMCCLDYGEAPPDLTFSPHDQRETSNLEKIPQLAAKWSLDPFAVDDRMGRLPDGIAGEWLRSPSH